MSSFLKIIRHSKNADKMLTRRPTAFLLLFLIAQRARRTNDSNFDDLEIGEALIGDYENYGQTEQIYRSDKKFLEKYKFITTRSTTKGTIAKIIDTSIFDINAESTNEQTNDQLTINQRSTNDQLTTNKNIKKVKNEKKYNDQFESFWSQYPRKVAKSSAWKSFRRLSAEDTTKLMEALPRYQFSQDVQYIPHAATWLNQRRWEDELGSQDETTFYKNYK